MMALRLPYLTPPHASGKNHLRRGEGTKTLCSSTEDRHANSVVSDNPYPEAAMCRCCAKHLPGGE